MAALLAPQLDGQPIDREAVGDHRTSRFALRSNVILYRIPSIMRVVREAILPALRTLLPVLAILVLALGRAGAAAELRVVASIKPIHSLVAAVMEGVGTPTLLIEGAAEPHSYALRPSDARALAQADVVFWIGEGLETLLGSRCRLGAAGLVVELADSAGLTLLAPRAGGAWAGHDEPGAPDDFDEHGRPGYDGHLWLDPRNAERLVARMAEALSSRDPAHAAAYRRNAEALAARPTLDGPSATLAPVGMCRISSSTTPIGIEARYGLGRGRIGHGRADQRRAPGARPRSARPSRPGCAAYSANCSSHSPRSKRRRGHAGAGRDDDLGATPRRPRFIFASASRRGDPRLPENSG
jgi:zinc transport system substrate-binding protein